MPIFEIIIALRFSVVVSACSYTFSGFPLEKSGKSLLGSAVSAEGLVNVYRGTGKVLLAPVNGQAMAQRTSTSNPTPTGTGSGTAGAVANAALGGLMNVLK